MKISVKGSISYSEFDSTFEQIFILKDFEVLEKRSMDAVDVVSLCIKLKEKVSSCYSKQLVLSNNGTVCAIGGGQLENYFFFVDLESSAQHKLTSGDLTYAYAPCFINGGTKFVAVSGYNYDGQGVEIWNIAKKQRVKRLGMNVGRSSASTNNILAFASKKGVLQLWDVRNWEMFYSQTFEGMTAYSLDLTANTKYLTIGGQCGDNCVVLEIGSGKAKLQRSLTFP